MLALALKRGGGLLEHVFVNLLRSSGIDSQPWRAGTTTLFVVQARPTTEDGEIDSWAP